MPTPTNRERIHAYVSKLEDIKADASRIVEDIRTGVNALIKQAQDPQAHQPEDLSESFAELDRVLAEFGEIPAGLRSIAVAPQPASGPTGSGGGTGGQAIPPAGSQADASVKSSGGGSGEGIVVGGDKPTGGEGVVVSDGTPTSDAGGASSSGSAGSQTKG